MRNESSAIRRTAKRWGLSAAAAGMLLAGSSCSDLTNVNAPDVIQRPGLATPTGAVSLFYGAVSTFYGTYGTGVATPGPYIVANGIFADELTTASTLVGFINPDRRNLPNGASSGGVFSYMTTARKDLLQAISVLKTVLPSQRWRIGLLYGLLGYNETMTAEIFCSGVPLSSLNADFEPVYGPGLTTTQLLQQAVADFDSAIVYSTDSVRLLNLAYVGKARTLMNLDLPATAATAVATVPTSFSFNTEHTAAIKPNDVATGFVTQRYIAIANLEGGNGLNFVTANDPRIGAVLVGTGNDGSTTVYRPARFTAATSPNILSNGIEARLIEAEAALRAGDPVTWLARLNSLRATSITPAMTPLVDPGTAAARIDLTFRERAFWLFLTGHRMGDLRRLIRQYGRDAATVFPAGAYKYGGIFEAEVNLPIDVAETVSNPMLAGKQCIDRGA